MWEPTYGSDGPEYEMDKSNELADEGVATS